MTSTCKSGFIPTKCSELKNKGCNFKVVIHRKHSKNSSKKSINRIESMQEQAAVDMKKARFEVYKFSKSDLNFSSRQKSNVELAIQLGAKPEKNKGVNYKQLKADKQHDRKKKDEERFVKQITHNFKDRISNKNKRNLKARQKTRSILGIYGKAKGGRNTKVEVKGK